MTLLNFRKYFILFTLLLNLSFAKAQLGKEAWHWQFGQNAAIDFSSGTPVTSICAINANEGCASISNPNTGQLLFYTDGTKAWDKNNNQMPNGFGMIGGQGTSTQAALIIPKPGSSTIYYLISADQGGYGSGPNQGIYYSIVDMSLNNGLGDIVSGSKNLLLTAPPTTEKLTAVRHCNGVDYWIINHSFNSNKFNVYLVTSSGISLTPMISNIGTVDSSFSGDATIGYLKASSNGKKLALGISFYNPILEIYDFNNATGVISNPITITYSQYGAYGVEFSPDNSKLYSTIAITGKLYQYDLSSNNASTIINSQTNIPDSLNGNSGQAGALQLASDGKIYISIKDSGRLAVINNPNSLGLACNYQIHGPLLAPGTRSATGLPNFIEANNASRSKSSSISLCSFPSYTLTVNGSGSYLWSSGDTTKNINIRDYGNYWVSFIDSQGCKEIDTFHIIQNQSPAINILPEVIECGTSFNPITINATYANTSTYLWNDGFTLPIHTISNTGVYWVDFILNNFCVSRDSFSINLYPYPSLINLGQDTSFCLGKKKLNAYTPYCTYIWNTGETTPSIVATRPGDYWVQVNYKGCKTYDSLMIYPEYDAFEFTLPNIVTPNSDGINDYIDFSTYQFSSLHIEIYNRWGSKVFESINPSCVWKPTENDGTYFLIANYIIDCGNKVENQTIKEFITIIR